MKSPFPGKRKSPKFATAACAIIVALEDFGFRAPRSKPSAGGTPQDSASSFIPSLLETRPRLDIVIANAAAASGGHRNRARFPQRRRFGAPCGNLRQSPRKTRTTKKISPTGTLSQISGPDPVGGPSQSQRRHFRRNGDPKSRPPQAVTASPDSPRHGWIGSNRESPRGNPAPAPGNNKIGHLGLPWRYQPFCVSSAAPGVPRGSFSVSK